MNVTVMIGRIVRDIEVEQTQSGKTFCRFSLALDSGFGEYKKSYYFNYIAWGKTAEAMAKWCKKGMKVAIESEAQQNRCKDNNGNNRETIEFRVISWEFAQGKNDPVEEVAEEESAPAPESKPKSSGKKPSSTKQKSEPKPAPKPNEGFMDIPADIDEILPFV